MGALLALLLEDRAGFDLIQRWGRAGFTVVLAGFVVLQFSTLQSSSRSYARSGYAFVAMLLLGILVSTQGKLQDFLSRPLLCFIGEISYGVYLVHILCLNVAETIFPPGKGLAIPAYVLACVISIGVAYILHWLVEKPMIRIGRELSRRLTNQTIVSTAQTSA